MGKINWPLFFGIIIWGTFSYLLFHLDKLENLPTFSIAFLALGFSYFSYIFSKEKFRLDLYEKRFEIYTQILNLCLPINTLAHLNYDEKYIERLYKILISSDIKLSGLTYHQTRCLFDNEISDLLKEISNHIDWLVINDEAPSASQNRLAWREERINRTKSIYNKVALLPELFKPYMYFGDYKH